MRKVNQEFAERRPRSLAGQPLHRLAGVAPARHGLPSRGRSCLHEVAGVGAQEPQHRPGQLDRAAPRHHPLRQAVGDSRGRRGRGAGTPGYVEPYPAFYAKIAELATTLREGLLDYGLIDSDSANKLETMICLAETLGSIAQKELTGEELTAEETHDHRRVRAATWRAWSSSALGAQGLTLSPAAEKSPLVADVHTATTHPRALEEATGYPLFLYAAFELDGELQLFVGASYSYYEFTGSAGRSD